ncbi:MAG: metallophosphoesterase [Actinomycetota bacterium]|nr:metallophosphoesterase [Actinomycetota bacterium]
MTRKPIAALIVALAAVLALPATGGADPAGKTTLEETIDIQLGEGFQFLRTEAGEPFVLRKSKLGKPRGDRAKRRRSLAFFGQFTDPQLADEMSTARLDFLDEAGSPLQDGNRPWEAMGSQLFDQMVRNMNANRTSAVKPGSGKNARLQFAINTGDMADSQQLNEVQWIVNILDGNMVDPFTGKPISDTNPCPNQSQETIDRINADVAARRYTGLQDYDDYPDAPAERKAGFWDPDAAPPAPSAYGDWPRYPGLLDRAQQPFQAEGSAVPWYTARGNHDGLVTGNVFATFPLARGLITGCQKIFPSANFDPNVYRGKTEAEVFDDIVRNPQRQQEILAGARTVAPDQDRRHVDQREYKKLHDTGDNSHGYDYVDKTELKRSKGLASYYAFSPRKAFRFVSMDTVAEGGGSQGNVDHPQYRWLERELDRNSSVEWRGSRLVRDRDKDRLIVVYSHHKLEDLTILNPDEDAGECKGEVDPGCDRDPRKSTPLHRGLKGKQTIRDLFLKYPNVIAFVTGHSHRNEIKSFARRGSVSGFWQINTASHVDFPQQARQIEVVDNRDGTLSLFNTILNQAAPVNPPAPGTPANVFTDTDLASIARVLSANDPQGLGPRGPEGRDNAGLGERKDRNVELPIRDPRRL